MNYSLTSVWLLINHRLAQLDSQTPDTKQKQAKPNEIRNYEN